MPCLEDLDVLPLLSLETRTYVQLRESLLREHRGEYVLIAGTDVLGLFPSKLSAAQEAALRVGARPVFILRIADEVEVDNQPTMLPVGRCE